MNKTWTRIVIVVVVAAAVAFWVFFDRQRAPEQQMDAAL
ncbi:topoisomerase II, partial [Escherichia coli]|nr:topoisomerase II [Escherichia coli]